MLQLYITFFFSFIRLVRAHNAQEILNMTFDRFVNQ